MHNLYSYQKQQGEKQKKAVTGHRRKICYAAIGAALLAGLGYACLPGESSAKHKSSMNENRKSLKYATATGLDVFRHVCTSTAIPSCGTGEYPLADGNVARLSFDPGLQEGLRKFLEKSGTPYAVFVAVEPKTGRVLANVSYSTLMPSWEPLASFYDYPMASLFKIVTAAAAFEAGKATPETPLEFRGRHTSESPKYWGRPGMRGGNGMPLSDAMAHSVNPAFGRLAADHLGPVLLLNAARQFGFDSYPFGGDFIASGKIPSPSTEGELMRMAAGLDRNLKTSPFHVAMMFAALGNGGVMPAPSFVDAVRDSSGKELYSFKSMPLLTVASPEVAGELVRSMSGTVSTGTAKKAFRGPDAQRYRGDMLVAGKTGSINGDNPRGHYSWFAGLAPAADPKIAFVAMVVNGDRWKLKAPQLGRAALDMYFRN